MKNFNFHSVKNVKEAVRLASGKSSYLAGGMTTIPAIKLRLASYSDIIDIKKMKVSQLREMAVDANCAAVDDIAKMKKNQLVEILTTSK